MEIIFKKCQVLTTSMEHDYELYDYYDGEVAYTTIEEAKGIIKGKTRNTISQN